jgi:hypothetical protein
MEKLGALLRAHEERWQRERLEALELTRTFAPLLAAMRKMEGQALTVNWECVWACRRAQR